MAKKVNISKSKVGGNDYRLDYDKGSSEYRFKTPKHTRTVKPNPVEKSIRRNRTTSDGYMHTKQMTRPQAEKQATKIYEKTKAGQVRKY